MNMAYRPILASSCARAATAKELRYRINREIPGRRGARIIGLDPGADEIVTRIAQLPWGNATFHGLGTPVLQGVLPSTDPLVLRDVAGRQAALADVLTGADVVVMVATTGGRNAAATTIGAAATVRALTVAGLVIGPPELVDATVTALRPHARVLMSSEDEYDVVEVLTALRA